MPLPTESECLRANEASDVLVNLTEAPYHCDPNGERDATEALCRALEDAMAADREAQLEAIRRMALPGAEPDGPETRPEGCHFPRNSPPATILYLPAGTYRVSDTIGYDWTDHLNNRNGVGDHLARGIHWLGDGPDKTILKLDDGAAGFDTPFGKPVLEILRGLKSAVCMQNTVEGLGIDTGRDNPGAVGIDFYSNNTGALRDVSVRSGDGQGICGVGVLKWNSSCALMLRINVVGFQYGIRILHHRLYTALEDITVRDQSVSGVWIDSHNVGLHRLRSTNHVPALTVIGGPAVVAALDIQAEGIGSAPTAVDVRAGHVYLRDLHARNHVDAVAHRDGVPLSGPRVAEWCSHPTWKLFSNQPEGSLRLKIEDPPLPAAGGTLEGWTCLSRFRIPQDGLRDATGAIEAALESGATCLKFPRGRFLITRQIRIPAHVQRIDFRFADFEAGPELKQLDDRGTFLIGDSDQPLFLERLFTMTGFMGKHRLLEHDGVRTLVLRDLHTQFNALYRNTVPGSKVFIENCACTSEGAEENIGLAFLGQKVWARQLNPERSHVQVLNDGGDLWVLGFKTENPSTSFKTVNGGRTEIFGGILNQLRNYDNPRKNPPAFINEESSLCVVCSTTDWKANLSYNGPAHVLVEEKRGGVSRNLYWEVLPLRFPHLVALPLYTGAPCKRFDEHN